MIFKYISPTVKSFFFIKWNWIEVARSSPEISFKRGGNDTSPLSITQTRIRSFFVNTKATENVAYLKKMYNLFAHLF